MIWQHYLIPEILELFCYNECYTRFLKYLQRLQTRAPNDSYISQFCDTISEGVLSQFGPRDNVVMAGDHNINLLNTDAHSSEYLNMFHQFSYFCCINLQTREQGDSSSNLDHVWCNFPRDVMSGVIRTSITDHYTTFLCIKNKIYVDQCN